MGITVFIDTSTTGVQGLPNTGNISANQQKMSGVLGNVLAGSIASVGARGSVTGAVTVALPGTISTSRTLSLTGAAATGGVSSFNTGSSVTGWGFNLSGMEWASYAYTRTSSSAPNRDFTAARDELVAFIANRGFKKTRLPVLWEMIQPVLSRQGAQSTILNAYGIANSGQLAPNIVRMIKQVLAAHAAAGILCYIDLHNYCRYLDFTYNSDGSVTGFTNPGGVGLPYASSATLTRVFSSGASPSLTQADFNDVWTKIATAFKGTAGLGGYMIMNEPHDLDANGTWPAYAQAAVNAIRKVDSTIPIYIGGNNYSNSTTIGTQNPGFPLTGTNLVYEAHMYLDASSSGSYFDYDLEVAKGFSVGEGGAINANTGFNRLKVATDWAAANSQKIAITECGLPLDDSRWNTMFKGATDLAWQKGFEWYTWMASDHWPVHSYPINYVPGYYQGQTVEPKVGGVMKSSMGLNNYTLFDSTQGYGNGAASQVITVTLFCRGYVGTGFNITVTRTTGAGTLSTSTVAMPAGANPSVPFTYTAAANEVASLTYSGPAQVPPVRKLYNLTDPVAYASTSLTDAGQALIAKYSAAKWVLTDGALDYMGANTGSIAGDTQYVRAIGDSGNASSPDNMFEMTNWMRTGSDYGTMTPMPKVVSGGLHKLDTGGTITSNWGTAMASHVNPVLGNLNKILACYYEAYNYNMKITECPTYFNVIYLFHLTFAGPNPNTNNNGDGTLTFADFSNVPAADVQTCRKRGQKVILSIGGSSNGYNISTRAQSTNLVNSFITIADQFGGVDGIDFNNYEASVRSSATELIWIVQQLRNHYGASFLATSPPGGNPDPTDLQMLKQMYSAGALSWAAPQFYDWSGYDAPTIASDIDQYVAAFNGDASAVAIGYPANNAQDAGPSVAVCQSTYDAALAKYPNIRGAFCWSAAINKSSSTTATGNTNNWGLWCKKQDIKETTSGEAIQPHGKEVVLFDIHDPHFVLAAVEVESSSSDGGVFVTNKAESTAFSELGMASGAMPVAKWQDYNGAALTLQSATALGTGAHVMSMTSSGSAQVLRVDKTQVASGARSLTANSGIGSNTHTIGWRFINYFERGTPGVYIYGVIAGKGSPTTAELTVLERYLGNNYAGLSL